jgi:hypothetical protein
MFDPADWETRHPSTVNLLRWFECDHLSGELQRIAQVARNTAHFMVLELTDGPELTTGLRKLMEAKDCFVRAAIGD